MGVDIAVILMTTGPVLILWTMMRWARRILG
jgi:hypothetical protein